VSDNVEAEPTVVPQPDSVETTYSVPGAYSSKQLGRTRELLTRLYAVRRTCRFYPMDHPAATDAVTSLKESIDRYHSEGVDVPLTFFEGELLLGETLLPEESILFDQLIREMTAIGVGSLTFTRGLDISELMRGATLLAADYYEVQSAGGMARMHAQADLPHIDISDVQVFETEELSGLTEEDGRASYDGALDLLREIDSLIRRNKAVSSGQIKLAARSLVDNVLANRFAMIELTGLKNHDEYTFYHSANVAILSLALGSQISKDYRFLSTLGIGALLHDIGKMTVDLDILNKPGALAPDEWAKIKMHPVYGAEQAALIPGLDKASIVLILEHHMRFDGAGYPTRQPIRTQHLASRIVAIADAYDAMTSRRSYSAARVQDEAMSLLVQSAGTALDPVLTRVFVSMMGVYPPRSVVRLDDGRTGVVMRPSENDPLKPVVKVIAAADGSMLEPYRIDLSTEEGVGVSRCLDSRDLNIEIEDYI